MGKHYCKIEKKWCKYIQHRNFCTKGNSELKFISRCPRLIEIETRRLSELLKLVDFDSVFDKLCFWFSDQKDNKEGYRDVFNRLLLMTPIKHDLTDLFIHISKIKEKDGTEWISVDGRDIVKRRGINYGIEFAPWNEWISMFITQETLDNFSKEEIVAGCLFEMTFYGFTENKVEDIHSKLFKTIDEIKNKLDKEKKL